MQHVDHSRAAHSRRIVYARFRETVMIAKLLGPPLGNFLHIVLAAKVQASCGTRLDARGLQPFTDAVRTQRALINSLRFMIEFRDVKWTAGDAIAAAYAVFLLKIDDAVGVLDYGTIRWTRRQASRLRAVHALVLAHQPHQRAVFALVLVELDQVPVVPARIRHGLVGVFERCLAEWQVV